MVEIEDLKDKLAYIEREKIVKIEEDITQIRLGQVETNTLVKEFSKAMDTVGNTMSSMTKAMQDISLNMHDNTCSIKDLNGRFTCFEGDMSDLRSKVNTQEKAIWVFIKNNIWKIVSVISVASIVGYLVLGKV